jgi:hypothetical protein
MSSTDWVTEHEGPGENASRERQQQEGLGKEGGYEETEVCSLPSLSLSVATVAATGELGVDGGRIAVPLAPTGMKPSIHFTSERTKSIEAEERSFCLDAN